MHLRKLGIGAALLVVIVLAWAWWDGGREPLRSIEQEVPVPEGLE